MKTFSIEHQERAKAELESQVGGPIHLYGFLQQPETIATLLAVRMDELHGLQIYIRTQDGMESWESWHWTAPIAERQAAFAEDFGPQIGAIERAYQSRGETFRGGRGG